MNLKVIPNAINTANLVISNIADDPTYFALQIGRRFRGNPVIRLVTSYLDRNSAPVEQRALGAMLNDDSSGLRAACGEWLGMETELPYSVFLANLCIASGEWHLAGMLLDGDSKSSRKIRAKARLMWSLGHMTNAIEILELIGRGRQLSHYRSELATFQGLAPTISAQAQSKSTSSEFRSVLYVATNSLPHTGSGYAQRTQSILKSLSGKKWNVKALTRVNYPINIGKLTAGKSDVVSGITYERCLPFPAKHDFAGRVQQQADDLLARVLNDRPDVLHTTTDFSNALAVRAVAEATGTPWIYEVRGQLADTWLSTRPEDSRSSERYRLFVEREADVARHADYVFTLGNEMKQNLVLAGVDESKISLLPNGIGEEFLQLPVNREDARGQLGLDSKAIYVGTVSSLVPYEGLSTVVEAIAKLASEHSNLRLLIVGDGTDRENLIRLAKTLGIESRCEFPGRVAREVAHLYHASLNAFVVPRVDSAVTRSVTPLKPVEAMASSVPVLASNLPALSELITDGESGHLIAAEDVSEWAEAIEKLILNPENAELMGKSGREFVLANRTWDQNAHHIVEVYERVINKAL
ncbi:putative group 1 glycosyl transferase [Glutamicibacter arilaitensis Re117]|uniref:Group 1 glycosyl transferase n=1 Tax=Glutamicibacter arilaitensis (strain DSM 16368 / CIP 108037 / IAM 15318 / JCM 13566 / NCIMB 14258 / Re117) TaxID=861360 RepID=A0ABP1U4D7_GLUAR|nr:glycosyltransferase family 4 protein [Glutamicibacter arilaitensis]CBT75628.1 putative group 1 glycosyl transferase [Glutamicibacter arilaitensis Re117]